jgi:hypothetical protein
LNDVVITLQAVVEVAAARDESTPWPVASLPPYSWLALSGDCTDEELGLFVAILADKIDVPPAPGPAETVDALLAEELLIVAGGLQVQDTGTATTVIPGCCAGLEDWRDWAQVLSDVSPWWGHDPGPEVEFVDGRLRIWQDGGPHRHNGRGSGLYVDVERSVMPALLAGVQRDLVAFLGGLRVWTQRIGLGLRGEALVQAIDRDFVITAPWDLPASSGGHPDQVLDSRPAP